MGYIYKITNTINKKAYVGITIKSEAIHRWLAHKSAIRNGRGCPLLAKAIKKYGEDAFTFQILIICFDKDVFKFEKEYILKYNTMSPNGYNVAEGGKSGRNFLGKTHSEETKKKIGEKSKERCNRPEHKERARRVALEFNKTNSVAELQKKSEKWKKALEEGRIGRKGGKVLDEVKQKISEGLKRYYAEHKKDTINHSAILRKVNGRKVIQYSKDNEWLASYDSIIEAHEKTQIPKSTIQSASAGRSKMAGGFIWKYAEEKKPKESTS